MARIQKQTYVDLLTSSFLGESNFVAKSITLDFLYGFENPCIAIVYLNESLNQDSCLARMELSCIQGILFAVKEYQRFYPTVIIFRFVITLINIVSYKLDDFSLDNYSICMEELIEFIGENIDFKLLSEFVNLGYNFKYSCMNQKKVEELFKVYCSVLNKVCNRLLMENIDLLVYQITSLRNTYNVKIEQCSDEKETSILNELCQIFNSVKKNKILFISNEDIESQKIIYDLRKMYDRYDIQQIDKECIYNLDVKYAEKVILLIDLAKEDAKDMLYLCGRLEATVKEDCFLACFYNEEVEEVNKILEVLINRYSKKDDFRSALHKFLA